MLLSYLGIAVSARGLAKTLIARFGSFGGVIAARPGQVADTAEVPSAVLDFFGLVRAAGTRLAREEVSARPVFDAWDKLIVYLRTTMAHQMVEQFRVLFLDRMNVLIADEVRTPAPSTTPRSTPGRWQGGRWNSTLARSSWCTTIRATTRRRRRRTSR